MVAKEALPGEFPTVDDAAIAFCKHVWDNVDDWRQFEYGGCLWQAGSSYRASAPETQYDPKRCLTPRPPGGLPPAGSVHSHTTQNDFSKSVDLNTREFEPVYLCAPNKTVKRFRPDSKAVDVIWETP